MIIDAMDILYTNDVNGFCIVSSDSDFTRLVSLYPDFDVRSYGYNFQRGVPRFKRAER